MEAAAAESSMEVPLISNGKGKKKFRARKTMTASCRQQLATLKTKKGKGEKAAKELSTPPDLPVQENAAAKIGKSPGVFPNGLKVSIEVSQVDSGINIGCSYNETWDGISPKSEDVPFSHTAHFVVRDFNTGAKENHIAEVDQVTSTTSAGGQVVGEDGLQITESALVQDMEAECEQDTITENLNASITVKIIDKDKSFKKTKSLDVVTPEEPPYSDSAALEPHNCAADCSNALVSPSTFNAVSGSVQPEQEQNAIADGGKKKRTRSESFEGRVGKRAKMSNSSLLDEIQGLVDRRINIYFEEVFAPKIQSLIHQTDLVRKIGNRTADIARHLRSIRRLEKRLKYAVTLQKQLGKCSTNLPAVNSSSEQLQNTETAPNASSVTAPVESTEFLPRIPSSQNAASSSTDLVVLSDNECEQPSSPEHQSNRSQKMDSTALHKIMESIKEHRKKARTSKVKTVIDLTDDEEQRCNKDLEMVSEHPAAATSSEESSSVENVFDKYSVRKERSSSNSSEAAASCDVNAGKQTLSKSPPPEESVAKPNTEPAALKPPQKPQLRLAQVQNPKGIALSWNISNVDTTCAPAKAYCLYVHQGDPNSPKKLWKKIGEIKALPLPMACTLTQFVEDTTYSFAMRAKDADGRFGPLCDIQSTTLKPQSSSRKS